METPELRTETNPCWWSVSVPVSWTHQHRDLSYIHEPFNDQDAVNTWIDLGFAPQRFTGDLYDMRFSKPDWLDPIIHGFDLKYLSWSLYRMIPGTVLPNHRDTYQRFKTVYGVDDIQSIVRCVIFLEDWQSGHYFEIDGKPIVSWVKGQGVCWRGEVAHAAANIGQTNRYTLQITGCN